MDGISAVFLSCRMRSVHCSAVSCWISSFFLIKGKGKRRKRSRQSQAGILWSKEKSGRISQPWVLKKEHQKETRPVERDLASFVYFTT